jgi:hypothetical protein
LVIFALIALNKIKVSRLSKNLILFIRKRKLQRPMKGKRIKGALILTS